MQLDAPRDVDDPGAVEWVARKLSDRQREAIRILARQRSKWSTALALKVSGGTLASLRDFGRGQRGLLPPLMVVTTDYNPFTRCADWSLTTFGKQVAQSLTPTSLEQDT